LQRLKVTRRFSRLAVTRFSGTFLSLSLSHFAENLSHGDPAVAISMSRIRFAKMSRNRKGTWENDIRRDQQRSAAIAQEEEIWEIAR